MQHLDIVFFAVVAVVLGWKLYSVLGRRTGNERRVDPFARPDPKDVAGREGKDAPAQIGARRPAVLRPDVEPAAEPARETAQRGGISPRDRRQVEADLAQAPDNVKDGLAAIAKADPTFDAAEFVGGAKIAFGMIVEGFAAGDTKMLQSLLSRELYESFAGVIAERQRNGWRQKTDVIGITQALIVGAELAGRASERSLARIKMKFVSEQNSVTEDQAGQVVEGDPTHVDRVIDIWTFARDTSSRDPNWQLVETEQPA